MKVKDEKSKSAEVDGLRNQLARALADYDNLRKRTESEKALWIKFASQGLVAKLLPILDTIEVAQKHINDQGLAIAISQFKQVLGEEGLEEIKPGKGDRFDPNIHEAVESLKGGKHGEIAELVMPGWKFSDGMVIRVAKVKVFS